MTKKALSSFQLAALEWAACHKGKVSTLRAPRASLKSLVSQGLLKHIGTTSYYSGVGGESHYQTTPKGRELIQIGRMFRSFTCPR